MLPNHLMFKEIIEFRIREAEREANRERLARQARIDNDRAVPPSMLHRLVTVIRAEAPTRAGKSAPVIPFLLNR